MYSRMNKYKKKNAKYNTAWATSRKPVQNKLWIIEKIINFKNDIK